MESCTSRGMAQAANHFLILVLPILITTITGCTVVHVNGAEWTQTHRFPGITNVQISPIHGQPALVTTEGIGVVAGGSSTSFGWMKEAQVFSDDLSSCSAYVLVHENADLENLKDTLKMLDRICVFTREGELWPEKR